MYRRNLLRTVLLFLLSLMTCSGVLAQVDVITSRCLVATVATYKEFCYKSLSTSVVYEGISANNEGAITLRWTSGRKAGIVTTASDQYVKSIKIEWDNQTISGRRLEIYGKKTKYDANDAFNKNGYKWGDRLAIIEKGDQSVYDFSGKGYKYIGIRTEKEVIHLKSITIEWEKRNRKIDFEKDLYETKEGESFVAPKLDGAEAYSSSDEAVATVDPKTGEVKVLGCGTTTISAIFSETDVYQKEVFQYTLMVHPDFTKNASFNFSDVIKGMFPGYELRTPLPDVFSLRDGDLEVLVQKGDEPSCLRTHNNEDCLYLSHNAKIEMRVPEGFKILRSELGNSDSSKAGVLSKTETVNSVLFSVQGKSGFFGIDLTVDYTGTYKIKMSSAGHVTFSGAQAYTLPRGLQGGIVKVDEANQIANVNFCVHQGEVVAQNQALILKGAPGEYTLVPTDNQGITFDGSQNRLCSVLTNMEILAPENHRLYVLSRKGGKLGFFWQKGSNEGLSVRNLANKAYLQLPIRNNTATRGLLLKLEQATGINDIEAGKVGTEAIFTLAGVRIETSIENLPKGMYIVKGKKVYIK